MTTIITYFHTKYFLLPLYVARALGAVARSGQLGRALHDNEVARFLARFVPLLGIGRAQFIFYLRDDLICQSL